MKIRRWPILLVFCSLSVGGLVASEPVCRVVVQNVVQAARHHTKATLARWAEWGKSHPNWKPRKHTRRPNPELANASWVCAPIKVNLANDTPNEFLLPEQPIQFAGLETPADNLFVLPITQVAPETVNGTEVAGNTPVNGGPTPGIPPVFGGGYPGVPILPVVVPPPVGPPTPPVPEPNYLLLMCGAFAAALSAKRLSVR